MSDGRVIIEVELNDGQAVRGISDIDKRLNGLDPSARKANSGIRDLVTSLGLVKLASAGFDILKQSLDAAISRFDTMESFPKVMDALGFSTEESAESVNKLADGIDGLPTKLDEVVSTTKRMASITGDLNKSTDATLALNNAMLASGASTSDAARGMDQYIQMLSKGEVDLQSWKTLQETMPIGLQKTAEAMGFAGESAQRDLYGALKEGEITFKDFQNQLIELGTGTGELAELAKINSEGIATSFGNLRNAASKGIANILKDLDNLAVAVTGKNIAKNLDSLKVLVNKSFSAIGQAIELSTPIIILSAKAFDIVLTSAKALSPVLIGVAAGYAALKVIQGVNSLILGSHAALQMAALSGKALTIVTQAKMTAQIADTAATKADIIAKGAQNGQVTIGTALIGLLTGGISAHTVVTTIATAATTAFNAALSVLTGGIGLVIGAVTILVGAAIALWKWLDKDTEATAKLKKEQEELANTSTQLNDASKQNILSRKESITTIESNAKANKDLLQSVSELASIETKSSGQKKMLKEQIDLLNKAYAGLNLKYNEETGNLSMSVEALNKKIDAQKESEKMITGQEQMLQISKEQADVDAKLAEAAELRRQYNEQLDGSWKESRKAKEGLKELDTVEEELKMTSANLAEEQARLSQVVAESSEAAATAVENGAGRQVITYESLSESQQTAVDNMRSNFESLRETATNAFDKISTQSEISLGQMVENMAHNQAAVQQWGENQAALLAWAGQNGHDSFIPFIESIGVDQAGVLAQMVQGVDGTNQEQAALLEQLAVTYDSGFGKAAQAGKDSMKLGLEGLPDDIREMVITPTASLNDEVRSAFDGMGKNVGEGAAQGINSTAKQAEDASRKMAENADKAFSGHMQIKSPSRLFRGYGQFIGQGLSLGIIGTVSIVSAASKMIANATEMPFRPLPAQMTSLGLHAMSGFNAGLLAGAGSVYATAASIANNVKRTIQSALDIKSPSRWMKNFIGKNMMIGWEKGLEQYSKLPVRAMEKASNMVKLPVLSAEMLVGNTPNLASVNHYASSNPTTNNYSRNYEKMFYGAKFEVRDENDIETLTKHIVKEIERQEVKTKILETGRSK